MSDDVTWKYQNDGLLQGNLRYDGLLQERGLAEACVGHERAIAGEKEERTMKVEVGKSYRYESAHAAMARLNGRIFVFTKVDGEKCWHDDGEFFEVDAAGHTMLGRLVALDEPTHQQAVVHAETKRPDVGIWDDEPGELERMRRVFATWDFRNGA